jgi:hypothetical protein
VSVSVSVSVGVGFFRWGGVGARLRGPGSGVGARWGRNNHGPRGIPQVRHFDDAHFTRVLITDFRTN